MKGDIAVGIVGRYGIALLQLTELELKVRLLDGL